VTNNDEELSISENTISSDKPINALSRNAKKKVDFLVGFMVIVMRITIC